MPDSTPDASPSPARKMTPYLDKYLFTPFSVSDAHRPQRVFFGVSP